MVVAIADRHELQNPFHSTHVPTILSFVLGDFDRFLVNHFGDRAVNLRVRLQEFLPNFTQNNTQDPFKSYNIEEILSNFPNFSGAELVKIINAEVTVGRIAQEMASYNLNEQMGARFNQNPAIIDEIERLEAIFARSPDEETKLDTLRENYLKGGFTETLYKLKKEGFTLQESLAEIASVNYRRIHTAHPTTVMELAHVQLNRDIKDYLYNIEGDSAFQGVRSTLGQYYSTLFNTALVSEKKLTVEQEIDVALYHQLNHWHAIPRFYEELEKSARAVYPENFATEEQEAESLNAMYINSPQSTWVGGDKDGNPYVTPPLTIHTLKVFNQAGRKVTSEAVLSIQKKLEELGIFNDARLNDISNYIMDDVDIQNGVFKSHTIGTDGAQICKMNHTKIIAKLEELLEDPAVKIAHQDIRILSKQLRTCGNSLGFLEYRENKSILIETMDEMFSNVIPQYQADLSPQKKEQLITNTMLELLDIDSPTIKQDHAAFREKWTTHLNRLEDELVTEKSVDPNSKRAKSLVNILQTLKRTDIALLNSSVVNDEIIAEADEVFQILGVELMNIGQALKLNNEKEITGARPYKRHIPLENITDHQAEKCFNIFGTVLPFSKRVSPLYETKPDLQLVDKRFNSLLNNPAYKIVIDFQRHFFRYRGNETFQKFYEAMSDTIRQYGGLSGGLAIQQGHRKGTETILNYCKQASCSHGGGMDAIRGGALEIWQKINAFGRSVNNPSLSYSHTSQGFETIHTMNGKFTGPNTIENICALIGVKSFWRQKTPESTFRQELRQQIDTWIEDKFMDFAGDVYRDRVYKNPNTAEVLARFEYSPINAAGDRGSRPVKRDGGEAISIAKARTIGLTKALHRNSAPFIDFAGMRENVAEMQSALQAELRNPNIFTHFGKMLKQVDAQKLPQEQKEAKAWQMLLHGSEGFRSIVDTRAINALSTNIEYMWERLNPNTPLPSMDKIRTLAAREEKTGDIDVFTAKLVLDVEASCKIVYQAYTGKVMDKNVANVTDMQRIVLQECFPHYTNHVARTRAALPLLNTISNNTDNSIAKAEAHLLSDNLIYRRPHEIQHVGEFDRWLNKAPIAANLRANLKAGQEAFYEFANNIVSFERKEPKQPSILESAANFMRNIAQAR